MTYCLAVAVDSGLVLASDSRTNAGVDNVNTYPKMFTFAIPDKAYLVLMTSGNLATTQAVVRRLQDDMEVEEATGFANCKDMSAAARYVGSVSVKVNSYYSEGLKQGTNFNCTMILAGQYKGKPHEIFMVYPEGNYIQSSPYSPFLQIGETKYGKPVLDRFITHNTSLEAAARCALVSLDSTMRSNLSVAPPFDLLIYEKNAFSPSHEMHLKLQSPYYVSLRKKWLEGITEAFQQLPVFDWEKKSS